MRNKLLPALGFTTLMTFVDPTSAEAGEQRLGTLSNNVAETESQRVGDKLTEVDFMAAPEAQALLKELFREAYRSELTRVKVVHTDAMQEALEKKAVPTVDGTEIATNAVLTGLKAESERVKDPTLEVYRYEALLQMLAERRDVLEQVHRYYVGSQGAYSVAAATTPESAEALLYHNAVQNANLAEERLRKIVDVIRGVERKLEIAKAVAEEAFTLDQLEQARHIYYGYYELGTNREKALAQLKEIRSGFDAEQAKTSRDLTTLSTADVDPATAIAGFDANQARTAEILQGIQELDGMIRCLEDMARVGNPLSGAQVKETTVSRYTAGDVIEGEGTMYEAEVSAQPECPDVFPVQLTVTNPFQGIQDPVFSAHASAWLAEFGAGLAGQLHNHDVNDITWKEDALSAAHLATAHMSATPNALYWSRRGNDTVLQDLKETDDLYVFDAKQLWSEMQENYVTSGFCEKDQPMDTCFSLVAQHLTSEANRGVRSWPNWTAKQNGTAGQLCPTDFRPGEGYGSTMMDALCDGTRELFDPAGNCTMEKCDKLGQMQGDGTHSDFPSARIYIADDKASGLGVPNPVDLGSPALVEMAWTIARGEAADDLGLQWHVDHGAWRQERNR